MTEITIRHPSNYAAERAYVFEVVCREFLGLEIVAIAEDRDDVSLFCTATQSEVRIADVFFQTPKKDWLKLRSLPLLPLKQWTLPRFIAVNKRLECASVPVIFGRTVVHDEYVSKNAQRINLGLDIFGSAFFLLTRYEEACGQQLDQFQRFPASAALATKARFLERPIVNEYVEILRSCFEQLGMQPPLRPDQYKVVLSHDVDRVFDTYGTPWWQVAMSAIGDIGKRRDINLASKRLISKFHTRRDKFRYEPSNTFNFIMDSSERIGAASAFYFITHKGSEGFDGDYTMDLPWVRNLLRTIHDRGHIIGLHASFNSYADAAQISAEFSTLQTVAAEEGIEQAEWGGRQHYLRWSPGSTWQAWEDAGLNYDSTLTFPEAIGFRSGTCYEYPAFNLLTRKALHLRERPLAVMETSLFSERYMNLSNVEAIEAIVRLSETCRRFGGPFTLLWHNDSLATRRQKNLYLQVVEAVE